MRILPVLLSLKHSWLLLLSCFQALQGKVSHLEAAWAQKEKFIQSSRMILKFRDDHISQLKRDLQTGQSSDPDQQNQQLQEEIRLLREQVDTLKLIQVDNGLFWDMFVCTGWKLFVNFTYLRICTSKQNMSTNSCKKCNMHTTELK